MISKAGSRTYERTQCPPRHPRLSPMERCLLKWAVIDRDDRVLDVGLGNGLMAEYLLRNMECEVCGVADDMELVRSTRGLVRSADLVYAAAGDIPASGKHTDATAARGHPQRLLLCFGGVCKCCICARNADKMKRIGCGGGGFSGAAP